MKTGLTWLSVGLGALAIMSAIYFFFTYLAGPLFNILWDLNLIVAGILAFLWTIARFVKPKTKDTTISNAQSWMKLFNPDKKVDNFDMLTPKEKEEVRNYAALFTLTVLISVATVWFVPAVLAFTPKFQVGMVGLFSILLAVANFIYWLEAFSMFKPLSEEEFEKLQINPRNSIVTRLKTWVLNLVNLLYLIVVVLILTGVYK